MAWELRQNGKKYYYSARRINGRVVKEYLGCGPVAEQAAEQTTARRAARKAHREHLADLQNDLLDGREAILELERAPLNGDRLMRGDSQSASPSAALELPREVAMRVGELLAARQAGDAAADGELAKLVDEYPALWNRFGDLGQQALDLWLNLIAGTDQMFRAALSQKVEELRQKFAATPTDPVGQLLIDRIVATWLQIAYADAKAAQNVHLELRVQEFLAKRQQQSQRQHLAALQAWRHWRRYAIDVPTVGTPDLSRAAPNDMSDSDPWIVPWPQRKVA